MKVDSIPIYWGNSLISQEFNENSFINIHAYSRLKDGVKAVLELEYNQDKLSKMLEEPWFNNNKLTNYFDKNRFCDFFENTVFIKKPVFNYFEVLQRDIKAQTNVIRKKIQSKITKKSYCHIS